MLVKVRINYLFTTPVMKDAFNLLQIGFVSNTIKIFYGEEYLLHLNKSKTFTSKYIKSYVKLNSI